MTARRRLAALRALAGVLAGRAPGPPPDRWHDVLEVATELLVGPALSCAVRAHRAELPPEVADALQRQHLLNVTLNLRFRSALTDVVAALNRAGVVPLLFKGSLDLAARMSDTIERRLIGDLDIAVPGAQFAAATVALEELGYTADPGHDFFHPHELPFLRAGLPGPVELHVELGSVPITSILPLRQAWSESLPVTVGTGEARGLSPTHQVLHNVLHSSVQDLNHAVGGLPLRQLLALAELERFHRRAIDWEHVHRVTREHDLATQVRDHLWLAHRLAGMELPAGFRRGSAPLHETLVLAGFALAWPPHLRRNLRFAFGRAYLDSLYGHGGRPLPLGVARLRHALTLARRDGRRVIRQALTRRI